MSGFEVSQRRPTGPDGRRARIGRRLASACGWGTCFSGFIGSNEAPMSSHRGPAIASAGRAKRAPNIPRSGTWGARASPRNARSGGSTTASIRLRGNPIQPEHVIPRSNVDMATVPHFSGCIRHRRARLHGRQSMGRREEKTHRVKLKHRLVCLLGSWNDEPGAGQQRAVGAILANCRGPAAQGRVIRRILPQWHRIRVSPSSSPQRSSAPP